MIMNYYEFLLDAPAQQYFIEKFFPFKYKLTEEISSYTGDTMVKHNAEIIEILKGYEIRLANPDLRNFIKEFLEEVHNNPENDEIQRRVPVVATVIFNEELLDYTESILHIEKIQKASTLNS